MENNQEKVEELTRLMMERSFGACLDEKQKRFLDLIRERGVCVNVTKEAKENKDFQELISSLSHMHKKGIIPSFQIIEV